MATGEFKLGGDIRGKWVDSGVVGLEQGVKLKGGAGAQVILTCGSGVTASILLFSLHMLGRDLKELKVYDGSWAEWGARNDLPRITAQDK